MTIGRSGWGPNEVTGKELLMAEVDRNAQFEKISGTVQAAKERTTAAWQKTRDELTSEVANAKDNASEAAGHVENNKG
jgi:hypothetical protein